MKYLAILVVFTASALGDEKEAALYSRLYAEAIAPKPVVAFLHGGPGYNSATFEVAVAESAAARFRMLIYDRAGCGRSAAGSKESYSFEGALRDLHRVLRKHGVRKPLLVGHSFGGTLALRAIDATPNAFAGVVLVSSPISYPDALANIAEKCRAVYAARKDASGRTMLDHAAKLKSGATRASFLFQHAMRCGLYSPAKPIDDATRVKTRMSKSPLIKFFGDMRQDPFLGFAKREGYVALDLAPLLKKHRSRVFAIYGAEDWALGKTGRNALTSTLPKRHVTIIERASHSVFVDARSEFLSALQRAREAVKAPPADAKALARAECKRLYDLCASYRLIKKRHAESLKELTRPLRDSDKEPLLSAVPKDPWGREYRVLPDGKRWVVVSAGPDGKTPSADDVRYPDRPR